MPSVGLEAVSRLALATREFYIDTNDSHTIWWVIDGRTAEPDVNWPGDLIQKCTSLEEARLALARALLEFVFL